MSCSFEITSDLPVVVGSKIVGSVVCKFSKPTKIKAIHVQFHGSEGTQTIGDTKDITRGTYVLVDLENIVIGEETTIPSGISKYEFSIDVPEKLPSSFRCFNGSIRYSLKAAVKRSFRLDIIATKEIEIVAYVDLNTYLPALQIEADYNTDRMVSKCCGMKKGRIILNAVIGKRLFLKGETITLDLSIINLSGVRVRRVYSKIMKTVTIYFQHPYPKEEIFRDFLTKSPYFYGVKGNSESSFTLDVEIPRDVFIPNLRYSKLFKITYQLQVIADLSGCNTAMVLQFKIYIGHLPFSAESFNKRDSFIPDGRESISSFRK